MVAAMSSDVIAVAPELPLYGMRMVKSKRHRGRKMPQRYKLRNYYETELVWDQGWGLVSEISSRHYCEVGRKI